jgi:hypothetical protein
MTSWNEPIDFFARGSQSIELLAPIYLAMDEFMRGDFFVPVKLLEQAQALGLREAVGLRGSVNQPLEVKPPMRSAPMVTCTYRDLLAATRTSTPRAHIHFQMDDFKGAAMDKVQLFICDEARQDWAKKYFPKKDCVVDHVSGSTFQVSGLAEAIVAYVREHGNLRCVDQIDGESIGIVYMAFGEKAAAAVKASVKSLRRIGLQIPVCVVGSTPVLGLQFIEWTGESPFDASQRHNFQFRAGRIKPKLYGVTPFERTLYIDADTEFMADILPGFEALSEYDVVIARENLTLGQLYNKKLAGWEINLIERDATIAELQAGENVHFLNSGVLFFRKCPAVETAMGRWYEEWMRWHQWDEQLSYMRAFYRTPEARVKILNPEWNSPHRIKGTIIFHNYGRGVVRMDVDAFTLTPSPSPVGRGESAEVMA